MDAADFRKWRTTLGYRKAAAARLLGVSRNTIQNWERGFTRVPTIAELASRELTRRWKQRPDFGPVALLYADEPVWPKPDYPFRTIFARCELQADNEMAIRQALRLRETVSFHHPLVIDQDGGIVWTTPDLLCECDKRQGVNSNPGGAARHPRLGKEGIASRTNASGRQTTMDMWDFKKWRRRLRYSQFEAAEKLGLSRGALQHWEAERTPIPYAVELACEELARRSKQQPGFGPVVLIYADEPVWPEADCPSRALCLNCELHPDNEAAIRQACRSRERSNFFNPLLLDEAGEVVWAAWELLNQCDKQKTWDELKSDG